MGKRNFVLPRLAHGCIVYWLSVQRFGRSILRRKVSCPDTPLQDGHNLGIIVKTVVNDVKNLLLCDKVSLNPDK